MKPHPVVLNRFPVLFIFSIFYVIFLLQVFVSEAQPPGSNRETRLPKASIFIDRSNKKNISGYVHITHAMGSQLKSPRSVGGGIINLKEAMKKWTNIETRVDQQVRLSSPELLKMPFVYIPFEGGFSLTASEKNNLINYLKNGGFIVLEQFAVAREQSASRSAYERMIRTDLGLQARIAPISNRHELYHCFFDFPGGPPIGGELQAQTVGKTYEMKTPGTAFQREFTVSAKEVRYLEGITLNGRLVGICSSKKYLDKWKERSNNEPQLRMGVNMIVFAVTQKGGLAVQ